MAKAKSRRSRPSKAEPFEAMVMDEFTGIHSVSVSENDEARPSNHSVRQRQAGERIAMKSRIDQLKIQRRSLTKKNKGVKKDLSKQIKHLIASTRHRHDQELCDLGIVPRNDTENIDADEEVDE